jgi:[protein-PII] uridylyltransferase
MHAAQLLSDRFDALVCELFARAERGSQVAGQLALVATGGWGRRQVCPYSDIDFILLAPAGQLSEATRVAEQMLYPLWDAGFLVGHAVREPAAAARLARDDLATATALLDARLLAGEPALMENLRRATRRAIAPSDNPNAFVARLADEKKKRHQRFGASIYLLEPNLKHGIGALRDLGTAVWAARARWSIDRMDELLIGAQISRRQLDMLRGALDFLLALRTRVQLGAGRAVDQLTFELQEAIAPELYGEARAAEGDVKPAVAPAVEALMREYYLHARAVVQVTDHLLEAATVPARRRPRIGRIDASFLLFNGKLAVTDPEVLGRPAELLRLFRVALEQKVPIYWHTRELCAQRATSEAEALALDQEAAQHFVAALIDERDAGQPSLLEQMHQVGILNALMPEFAPCTGRVQHDLYHVYTVDQHQLYTVAMLKRIARGELAKEHPLAAEAIGQVQGKAALYLGTLLHDVGKPLGKGHSEKGARLALSIARRLGLSAAEARRTEYLVREHLTMSHVSQRRDLADPAVIRKFAERVADEETLRQLYLLTLCDTAMTSPGNLNAWKEQLLGELYQRTCELFRGPRGGELADAGALAQRARERAVADMTRDLVGDEYARAEKWARAFVDGLDERLLGSLTSRQLTRHLRLVRSWQEAGGSGVELAVTDFPLKGTASWRWWPKTCRDC